MRSLGSRAAPHLRAALLIFSVLGLPGCRSTVTADPRDWTVERALAAIRRVEAGQIENIRRQQANLFRWHGLEVHSNPTGLPRGGPGEWSGTWDANGFGDFHVVRWHVTEEPRTTREQVGFAVPQIVLVIGLSALSQGSIPFVTGGHLPPRTTERSVYGFQRIVFADIRRVVISHGGYPLLGFTIFLGPWQHDVELEMKSGRRIVVYEKGARWLNLLPVWLYPACWIHTPESYEYAEALEYLRARAAGEGERTLVPQE